MTAVAPVLPFRPYEIPPLTAKTPGSDTPFSRVLQGVLNHADRVESARQQLLLAEKLLIENGPTSARDLLVIQKAAGQFQLQVELVSKIADAVLSTTRRLQGGQ